MLFVGNFKDVGHLVWLISRAFGKNRTVVLNFNLD